MHAIELSDVLKRYDGRIAVDRLSLAVRPGEIYALLGPNGAGKTTTIRMLLGFTTPDGGTIRIAGIDAVADPAGARGAIAYIPEAVQVYPELTGLENLDYFSRLAGRRLGRDALVAHLERAGLPADAAARRSGSYSKGMRQKVGLAIAFAKGARVLLLDEPTSGLDPDAAQEFNVATAAVAASGVAVLMATHDLLRARQIAARLGVLRRGRLAAERAAADVTLAELESLYLSIVREGVPPTHLAVAS